MRPRRLSVRLSRFPSALVSSYRQVTSAATAGRARVVSAEARTFAECYTKRRLDPGLVLYQAHTGAGMVCNPYAIFRELLNDPEFSRLTHVWVLDSDPEIALRSREYAGHHNVRFVRFRSPEYVEALATAGFLIQNTSFPSYFAKRPGQVYVNTWHSAGAVKSMGFDTPGGVVGTRNVLRDLLMADFILSPNALMTRVFTDSYRLKGLYQGKILQFGYPRNDVTLHTPREEVVAELRARGVKADPDKKIILYAPTWRGTLKNIRGGSESLEVVRRGLAEGIDSDEYQILIKPHQYHFSRLTKNEKESGEYIPRQFNANRLLAAVDILVSDYSSIFFDFMVTDRPILFYVPDKQAYAKDRGVNFGWDDLPGPSTESIAEVAGWVNHIDEVAAAHADRYAAMKAVACADEDGHSAARAVDAIFRKHPARAGVDCLNPRQTRVLLHVSDLSDDQVAASLLALLPTIDRDRFDITVAGIGPSPEARERAEQIRDVRVLVHTEGVPLTRKEAVAYEYVSRYGLTGPLLRYVRPDAMLAREYSRRFGDSRFDVVIEYSAYPGIFPWLALREDGSKRFIWQHTEVLADLGDKQKARLLGRPPVSRATLTSVYETFDAVVASCEPLAEVNRSGFGNRGVARRFTSVDSVVDAARVSRLLAEAANWKAYGTGIVADVTEREDGARLTLELPNDPPVPECGEPYVSFATMGPLLPEKDTEQLVLAFSDLVTEHPNCRLFIIGEGPLRPEIEQVVAREGLRDRVCVTGGLRNPFAVLQQCHCFVLPSRYEGFSHAVMEARLLGLPIILGDFASSAAVSVPDGQFVVERSREGVLEGLRAFVRGAVPTQYTFDIDAHNRRAVRQFESLIARPG